MSSQLPAQRIEVASERSVRVTWWWTLLSLVFVLLVSYLMIPGVIFALGQELDPFNISYLVVAALAFLASACWLWKTGLDSGIPAARYTLLLALPSLATLVLAGFVDATNPFLLLPAWWSACCVLSFLPRRRLVYLAVVVGALLLVFVVFMTFRTGVFIEKDYLTAPIVLFYFWFLVLMFPVVLISGLWWWRIVVQLNLNRKAYGDLSVARERLRFAADLHDIQGHHLQVIALKTELAERVMDHDAALAKQQIHEAQVLARTALEDTRALVRGYRQVAFTTELKNAAEVLEAAAIKVSVQVDDVELSREQGSLFGSVVREGTTNILRHSSAADVLITFGATTGAVVLSMRNDGVPQNDLLGGAITTGDGTGLAALRERLEAVGGSFDYGSAAGVFEITAKIPEEL